MADLSELLDAARRAAEDSYSPYSHFRVGAALLCKDGTVITGTNVENRSYGLTNCAERSAIFTAISAGKRNSRRLQFPRPTANKQRPAVPAVRS